MIEKLAENVALLFLKKNIIEKDDLEIYIYGSELLISEMVSTIIVIAIGIVVGRMLNTLLYLLVFTVIRVYAGGYHASTHRNCIALFTLLFAGVLLMTEQIFDQDIDMLLVVGTIASVGVIFLLAPVEDHHKPLESSEVDEYKRKARVRALTLSVFIILTYKFFPRLQDEAVFGMMAICEIAFLLVLGYAKNRVVVRKRIL